MRQIRGRDMRPEILVRRVVHKMGFRYRLHQKDLPGKPDLVFRPRKKVIFVHGCFWHQHHCLGGRLPKSNIEYWHGKLQRNVQRDQRVKAELEASGWQILIIWECEIKPIESMRKRLSEFLSES